MRRQNATDVSFTHNTSRPYQRANILKLPPQAAKCPTDHPGDNSPPDHSGATDHWTTETFGVRHGRSQTPKVVL